MDKAERIFALAEELVALKQEGAVLDSEQTALAKKRAAHDAKVKAIVEQLQYPAQSQNGNGAVHAAATVAKPRWTGGGKPSELRVHLMKILPVEGKMHLDEMEKLTGESKKSIISIINNMRQAKLVQNQGREYWALTEKGAIKQRQTLGNGKMLDQPCIEPVLTGTGFDAVGTKLGTGS